MVMMNGMNDVYREMTAEEIQSMDRDQLVEWLEFRGTACYDDEPTELLRDCALEDLEIP
jgi:hypothetical protein